jgi:hypothetical protein
MLGWRGRFIGVSGGMGWAHRERRDGKAAHVAGNAAVVPDPKPRLKELSLPAACAAVGALASGQEAPGGDMARIAGNCHQKLGRVVEKARKGAGFYDFGRNSGP